MSEDDLWGKKNNKIAVLPDTTSLQRGKKRNSLANWTQIRESESASAYLCVKVIISAPFINMITADSVQTGTG